MSDCTLAWCTPQVSISYEPAVSKCMLHSPSASANAQLHAALAEQASRRALGEEEEHVRLNTVAKAFLPTGLGTKVGRLFGLPRPSSRPTAVTQWAAWGHGLAGYCQANCIPTTTRPTPGQTCAPGCQP